VSELVIVLTDVYLDPDPGAPPSERGVLAGIESVTRFARARALEGSWREWAACWLGLERYAHLPPASVAAAAAAGPPSGPVVWLAEPLHLTEGIGRVHLERRGRLRLAASETERLAADFNTLYAGSGFALAPLPGGTFVLAAPAGETPCTCEPARVPAGTLAESLPSGRGAGGLRRLGAELEMWLHQHPLNAERAGRGEPPISALWIWGGGAAPAETRPAGTVRAAVYGAEAYLAGLARPAPPEWPYARGGALAPALHALEVRDALQREPGADLLGALADLDRRWISPAVAALGAGALERLWLLANDRAWGLRARDRWRRWRRTRTGLEAMT
jgi:hypothetical protein